MQDVSQISCFIGVAGIVSSLANLPTKTMYNLLKETTKICEILFTHEISH
jgi:hypothetical protein